MTAAARLLWLWLAAGPILSFPSASEAGDDRSERSRSTSNFKDIQAILDAGVIRVVVLNRDIPPMVYTNSAEQLVGLDIELAKDIGKKLGVRVEFIRTSSTQDEIIDEVARLKGDIALSFLSSDVQSALVVAFTQPYIQQNFRLLFNRGRLLNTKRATPIKRAADLLSAAQNQSIGVVAGSVYQAALSREYPHLKLKTYPHFSDLAHAIKTGALLIGLHGELQAEYYFRQHSELAIDIGFESLNRSSDIRMAVRPDAPNLLNWLNIYLENYLAPRPLADILEHGLLHQ